MLRAKSVNLANVMKPKYQQIVQQKYGLRDWDSVLAAVGHGGLKEGQVINKLWRFTRGPQERTDRREGAGSRGGE